MTFKPEIVLTLVVVAFVLGDWTYRNRLEKLLSKMSEYLRNKLIFRLLFGNEDTKQPLDKNGNLPEQLDGPLDDISKLLGL